MKTINELASMKNKVALITGGGGHIALAMSEAILESGGRVLLVDMNQDRLDQSKAILEKQFNVQVDCLRIDLENQKEIETVPSYVESHYGRLDVLINNAGFVGDTKLEGWCVPFEDQSIETWRRAVEVNLNSAFYLSKLLTPLMKKTGNASVINVGSIYGMVGPDMGIYEGTTMGNPAAYAASKGGLIHLSKWMSTVLAPDIRVNSMTPGGVFRNQAEAFHAAYLKKTPLKRMATEEDFKGATIYLASNLSSYVTGHNLVIDGGWTAW